MNRIQTQKWAYVPSLPLHSCDRNINGVDRMGMNGVLLTILETFFLGCESERFPSWVLISSFEPLPICMIFSSR